MSRNPKKPGEKTASPLIANPPKIAGALPSPYFLLPKRVPICMAGPVALKPNRKSPIYLREYGSLRSQGQTPAQAMGIADRRFVRKMVKLARIQTVKEREQIGARDAAMFLKRKRALGNIRKALEKALGQLRDKYPSARGRVSEMEARIVESVIGDATVDAQQRTGTAPQVDLRKWVAGYAVMRTGLLKIRGDLSGQIRSSPSRNEIRRMAVDISDAKDPYIKSVAQEGSLEAGYGLLKGFAGGADGADARAAVRDHCGHGDCA